MLHRFSFVNLSKGVSRVESAFSLTREKLGPNRRAGRLKKVVAHKALKGGRGFREASERGPKLV